jgi:hypothetical protein
MSSSEPHLITRDLPCTTCGYNLRTQPTDAHCPECDTPATQTFQACAARLAGADRRWLRKLTSAAAWLTLSMLIPATFAFVKISRVQDPWRMAQRRQTNTRPRPDPLHLRPRRLLAIGRKGA